jgi:hypothetical protein
MTDRQRGSGTVWRRQTVFQPLARAPRLPEIGATGLPVHFETAALASQWRTGRGRGVECASEWRSLPRAQAPRFHPREGAFFP